MPYLTCVGPQGANRHNKGKIGSRGYWLFRRGTAVVTRWGPIDTTRGQTYSVCWVWWQEKVIRCRTVPRARAELKRILTTLQRPSQGYSPLPRGIRIR